MGPCECSLTLQRSTMAEKMNNLLCGGYSFQFVDSDHSKLKIDCSICSLTLREPYQVDCCGSRFCKACLDPLFLITKLCPSCKGHFSEATFDSSLKAMINKKLVYCRYKSKGCLWTGELQKLEKHELSCINKPIKCEFCKEFQGTNKEMKQHTKSCSAGSRLSPCPKGCGANIMLKNIETHVREKCPRIVVKCKYCKDFKAPQNKIKKHEMSCHSRLRSNPTPDKVKLVRIRVSCPNECGTWLMPNEVKAHTCNECPCTVTSCEHCKTFQAPRNKMNDHVRSCPRLIPKSKARSRARLSPCPNGCGVQMKPKDIVRHIQEHCPLAVVVCRYCKEFKAPPKKIESHEESCSSNIEVCPNGCGMKMHTSKIKAHTDNECSFTVVSCEFAYTGCKVEKRRCEMDKHIEEEHPFLASMATKVKQLEVEVEELILDNEDLVCMCSDVNRLRSENKRLRAHEMSMSEDYQKLQMEIEKLHSQNVQLKSDNEKLKKDIASRQKHVTINLPKRLQKRILDQTVNYKNS